MLETGPGLFVWACIHWGPIGNGRGAYVSLNLPKKKCLEIVDKIDQIFNAVIEHFQKVYKAGQIRDLEECMKHVPKLVTEDMNVKLMAQVEDWEIKEAVFSIGALKAPGPDGFNALFFQKNWKTIKDDIGRAVKAFFHHGIISEEVNETLVALAPKVPLPESINQRPISCCNVVAKIISKIFVMRLKQFMGILISHNQSAFVGGRLIQDNLIIAHEIFHSLKRKDKGVKRMLR